MDAPMDVTNIRIETARLILRAWQMEDLDDFFEYAKVDGVGQMAGWQPHMDMEESRAILEMFIQDRKTLAVVMKETGKVVGSLGLEPLKPGTALPEPLQGREIGYVLSRDYWGQGLMPEAVNAIIDYCFQELKLDYLTCGHFNRNDRSRRVIEKCGFQYQKDIIFETCIGAPEPGKMYLRRNDKGQTA